MPASLDPHQPTGPDRHPAFDLQRVRASRAHVSLASSQLLTSAHRARLALDDPAFRSLSPDTAAVVLRKSLERVHRELRRSLDR